MRHANLQATICIALAVSAQPTRAQSPAGLTGSESRPARAILYHEDAEIPEGRTFAGTAIWRIASPPHGSGGSANVVQCDVNFSDPRVSLTLLMERNDDKALPATHTIEARFNVPGFAGVASLPGFLLKTGEQARGVPLRGVMVKMNVPGHFLFGLSAAETDKLSNFKLLKDYPWFDVPFVYGNTRRAIIAIERGDAGMRHIAELIPND